MWRSGTFQDMPELLLMSSSRVFGGGYLEYARDTIIEFLDGRQTVHFVPFALADQAAYTAQVTQDLANYDARVVGLEELAPYAAIDAVETADALSGGVATS